MLMSTTWEQTAIYSPNDPTQRNRVVYASPGGWASYYWNRVPDAGVLNGLGAGFSSLPQAAQIGLVTVIAAVVGFAGYAALGDKYIRPGLKKIGLAGSRRRR
jgi:hypothetical protein